VQLDSGRAAYDDYSDREPTIVAIEDSTQHVPGSHYRSAPPAEVRHRELILTGTNATFPGKLCQADGRVLHVAIWDAPPPHAPKTDFSVEGEDGPVLADQEIFDALFQ
jgi:hypothetical protein